MSFFPLRSVNDPIPKQCIAVRHEALSSNGARSFSVHNILISISYVNRDIYILLDNIDYAAMPVFLIFWMNCPLK